MLFDLNHATAVTQSLCLHNISQIPEGMGQAARCWCCCSCCSCCSCWLEMFRNYSAGKLAALSACFSVCTTPHTPDTQKFCSKHNYRENLIHKYVSPVSEYLNKVNSQYRISIMFVLHKYPSYLLFAQSA